jgi:putative nucleotidyltransferase with HDIG domain
MLRLFKKKKIRREQARKGKAATSVTFWQRYLDQVGLAPTLLALSFFLIAFLLTSVGRENRRFKAGDRVDQPIVARVDFEVVDETETERLRQKAGVASPSHYDQNHQVIAVITSTLEQMYAAAREADQAAEFLAQGSENSWPATEALYGQLRSMGDDFGAETFQSWVGRLRLQLLDALIYDPEQERQKRIPPSTADHLIVHLSEEATENQNSPKSKKVGRLDLLPNSSQKNLLTWVTSAIRYVSDAEIRGAFRDVLMNALSNDPVLVFDEALTEAARQQKLAEIPDFVRKWTRGQAIIDPQPGQGRLLSAQDEALLVAEQQRFAKFIEDSSEDARAYLSKRRYERAGTAILCALLTFGFFGHAWLYQRRIIRGTTRGTVYFGLILGAVLVARVVDAKFAPTEFVLSPMLLTGSLLAIAYTRRFALGAAFLMCMLLAVALRAELSLLMTLLAGLVVVVFAMNEIRTRTRVLYASLMAAGLTGLVSLAFGMIGHDPLKAALARSLWAAAGAGVAPVIVQMILPLVERLGNIATPLALMEWRDTTKSLLQRLSREATGTYQHSVMVSDLAKACCESIGANALLAQVGALYHDIGKIPKADYFAENQEAQINRHDKLSPTMSLLIIVGHVKDGVEMAREYKIPRVLNQFIEEHHGTTVVRYFHHVASEKQPQISSGKHDREVSESEFRYPGPKPRSRETAVLMICDGAEGAVRALPEPTPGRIETVVHSIVKDRLNDGQFDDCDITLKDLATVEDTLVKTLSTIYHGRVAYPKGESKVTKSQSANSREHENGVKAADGQRSIA